MGSVAVCCGFNHYEHVPVLTCALNDAVHPYAELTRNPSFNADPSLARLGKLFTQRTTSADEVLGAFAVAVRSHAELVWFSFSGHAMVSSGGELRLLLPEWRADATPEERRRRSIRARDLEDLMRPHLASKKFVIVLDTCFSGAYGSGDLPRDLGQVLEGRIASAGAVVLSACAADEVASDGQLVNGAFTGALIEVLREHSTACTALTVFELFCETRRRLRNGQRPTLHAAGLTDDFAILAAAGTAAADDVERRWLEIPRRIESVVTSVLANASHIHRAGRVGLVHAERTLQRLAGELYMYAEGRFAVSGTNDNVVEAFEGARECIVGCTTPRYFDEWLRSGIALLAANEQFIRKRGGRVVRFFFVHDDLQDRAPGAVNVIRDHVRAGVRVVIVLVPSFGAGVMRAVFNDPEPRDLSALEQVFVDGRLFMKVNYIADGHSDIEIDQSSERCRYQYRTQLKPFLDSHHGRFFGAALDAGSDDQVSFRQLLPAELEELRRQLERDLGIEPSAAPRQLAASGALRLSYGGRGRASMRRSQVCGVQVRSRAGRAATARRTRRRVRRMAAR